MTSAQPTVRTAVEADIIPLATVWFNGWHEAHAHLLPAALTEVRTLARFRERIRDAIGNQRAARFYEEAGWRNEVIVLNRVNKCACTFALAVGRFEKSVRGLDA